MNCMFNNVSRKIIYSRKKIEYCTTYIYILGTSRSPWTVINFIKKLHKAAMRP